MKITYINIFLVSIFVTSCGSYGSDSKYDSGYSDGYASGYNTTCKIRSTMIEGDWDSTSYTNGYNDGYSDGAKDCKSGK